MLSTDLKHVIRSGRLIEFETFIADPRVEDIMLECMEMKVPYSDCYITYDVYKL